MPEWVPWHCSHEKRLGDDVSDHKFKVGQTVYYTSGVGSTRRSDVFKIVQRLPTEGKRADAPYDRLVKESELKRAM